MDFQNDARAWWPALAWYPLIYVHEDERCVFLIYSLRRYTGRSVGDCETQVASMCDAFGTRIEFAMNANSMTAFTFHCQW